ncbi:MAG: helix-turn-helix domain-containing protein [Bacteroidia bacterium]
MLYLSGVVITFFLLLLLAGKKGKSTADIILACWLGVIGLHLFLFYLFISGKIYSYPWLLGTHFPMPLMHGPFLYLYAAALTGNLDISNKKYLLHFIPAILCYIYLIHYFLLPPEQKVFIVRNLGIGYEKFMRVMVLTIIISGIIYFTVTTLLHRKHRRNILNQFSNTEKINLDWIQYLMYGIGVIWLFVIFGEDKLIFTAVVFFVLFMGFFGIRQTPVFTTHNRAEKLPFDAQKPAAAANETENLSAIEPPAELNEEKGKYQKSGLDEYELQSIHVQLTDLMAREKLYTNPELTLGDTAQQLHIHPNYLSQVINSVTKKNFYDYINSQRVEEFNRIVKDAKNQKFTLLSLAFECGFNSKTSFNRNFRKVTGLSPTQYLKQINVSFDPVN